MHSSTSSFVIKRTLKGPTSLFSLYQHRSGCKNHWTTRVENKMFQQSSGDSKASATESEHTDTIVQTDNSVDPKHSDATNSQSKHKTSSVLRKIGTQICGGLNATLKGDGATMKHHGLSFCDFDRTGNPNLHRVLQYMQGCRMFVYNVHKSSDGETFFDFPTFTENSLTFMVSSEGIFSKEMYDPSVSKAPLVSKMTMRHIGKTSYTTKTLLSTENDQALVENSNRVVFVDKITRKPTMLPEWWFKKYQYLAVDENQLKVHMLLRPENVECFQVKVTWSDTDNNNHTNWAAYHKFCWDAAYHFSRENLYSKVTEETLRNGVKSYRCIYIGEAMIDDLLDIYSWDITEGELKFDIVKGQNSIFQSTIELF